MLPLLDFPGIYEKSYQRVSLAMLQNKFLCVFWLKQFPCQIYAVIDTKNPTEWKLCSLGVNA